MITPEPSFGRRQRADPPLHPHGGTEPAQDDGGEQRTATTYSFRKDKPISPTSMTQLKRASCQEMLTGR
jgi:hypothetical protein